MKKQTTFPDLSQPLPSAMGEKTVELNGQKVLFDKKVMLMPIQLERK